MEQEIRNKLYEAWKLVTEKENKFNTEWNKFEKEWFTKDIKNMLSVIVNHTNKSYSREFAKGIWIYLNDKEISIREGGWGYIKTDIEVIDSITEYNDSMITRIEYHADIVKHSYRAMRLLRECIPNIIEGITREYKNITENQLERINGIFEALDIKDEPIKHIKVTVEWI